MFTPEGLTGPLALSASAYLNGGAPYRGEIDLKPALDRETLDARILRDFREQNNRNLANALGGLLPRSLIPVVIARSGIAPDTKVHSIRKENRAQLLSLLKAFTLTVVRTHPIDEAIITRGGVSLREVSPKTLQSKLIKGLYFAGEMLDLDALTGGINLQIALSTGYLAGLSI